MGTPPDQIDKIIKPGHSAPGKVFKYKSIQKNMLQIAIFDNLIKHGIFREDAKAIVRNKIPEYIDPNKPLMCIETGGDMQVNYRECGDLGDCEVFRFVVLNVAKMMAAIRQILSKL